MFIESNIAASLLCIELDYEADFIKITDINGEEQPCPILSKKKKGDKVRYTLDAEALKCWSVNEPVLYILETEREKEVFGHTCIRTFGNDKVLLNEKPIYLRGYIRGIIAHDHPNMTGLSDYEAAKKNISQAKKYGFNLVRFHSTIPGEEFLKAADELGLLVHIEIGFAYEYDSEGNKKNLSMNNELWEKTILKYRNHPSLAIFCIGNEMHNAGHYPEVRALYEQGKALAPNKLILDNSGWGEYDRSTADIFCQHIAYFFPYAHHGDMFTTDACWKFNGSAYDAAMEASAEKESFAVSAQREAVPLRPTLSHEAIHYIDIPDYEALNRKFDRFVSEVGEDYIKEKGIKKPRFLTELPKLIEQKGLKSYMADYIRASRHFKLAATKVFLEKLRLSGLCGYEMLQFADCLKYENKNGIVDCFDDDKGIDAAWFRQMNDDLVLLNKIEKPYCRVGEKIKAEIYASDFLREADLMGDLVVTLDGEELYRGDKFVLAGGLQRLVTLNITMKKSGRQELEARFESEKLSVKNNWSLWAYENKACGTLPELNIENSPIYVTDSLDEKVISELDKGKNVLLIYDHSSEKNKWQFEGAVERFKPCIWDRGSNLGGVIKSEKLINALGGELFDLNMQPLLEGGSKVNLDDFPVKPTEFVLGVDKPVRDRMKGLIHGVKNFIPEDTIRRFSHLFSLKVGKGQLTVCTFKLKNTADPVVESFIGFINENFDSLKASDDACITKDEFVAYLDKLKENGIHREDVMNHFWELDNKMVEDTLFWEESGVDLAKMKD